MIPKRWQQQYDSILAMPRIPKQQIHALKTTIEEIGALESEKARAYIEKLQLEKRLNELENCQQDNKNLSDQIRDLREALRSCQEEKSKGRSRPIVGETSR